MRLRLRFTVRQMLVTIATIAIVLGGGRETLNMLIRSIAYRDSANYYSAVSTELLQAANERREARSCLASMPNEPPPSPARFAQMRKSSVYFAYKANEYRRAAARPWLTVKHDD